MLLGSTNGESIGAILFYLQNQMGAL